MTGIYIDSIYAAAKDLVIREQTASCSFLQRRLAIGYVRASQIMERLFEEGIIGDFESPRSCRRKVLVGGVD